MQDVNRENVKMLLDVFHMNIEEDSIAEGIRRLKGYIGEIHAGEKNRKVPGKGTMPWDEIAQALYASPRAALRMHQRALRQVDILLAEREDCR